MLHEDYLPFSEEQLRRHFAPVAGDERADPDRHVAYYANSIGRWREYQRGGGVGDRKAVRLARQIEKDERFWVAASLLALYYGQNRRLAFSSLLSESGAEPPAGFDGWREALAGDLELFFEVGLNSPRSYREYLKQHLDERAPIPYVREAAERAKLRLEGSTYVDAILLSPESGVGVLFEAKVLSDCSSSVTYDVLRNQLARNVDVMLDRQEDLSHPLGRRDPDLSAFVLLTPELFRRRPHTRLYGWLMQTYKERPGALGEDLPHRQADWSAVSSRIGWATFEDCRRIEPLACKWLGPDSHSEPQGWEGR